jgi:malonate transporter
VRLLGFPLVALAAGLMLGLPADSLAIVMIAAATPTASSGYILARQLGGDATLSANLVAVQTVFSVLSMPAIYALYLLTVG